jgi:tetratricopeptide (TPR) repeat protein
MVVDWRALAFRYIVAATFFALSFFAGGMAAAQTQQQFDQCSNRGNVFSSDLQIRGCTAVIQSGQRSARDLPWAFYNRALAYYSKGDYERVIVDFSKAIRLNPKDSEALNGRCWVRAIIGRELQLALADCNESLRLRADDAATLDSRGFTCLKLGQFGHAIADYDAALQLDANQAASYYGRGVAWLKKGDSNAGNADVAAAKAIQADIVVEFAKYGIQLDAGVVSIAPTTASGNAECARTVAHWKPPEISGRLQSMKITMRSLQILTEK